MIDNMQNYILSIFLLYLDIIFNLSYLNIKEMRLRFCSKKSFFVLGNRI